MDNEEENNLELIKNESQKILTNGKGPLIARFALAVISGAIPVGGGVVGGISGIWSEKEQEKANQILISWLKLQQDELEEIGKTIFEILSRVDQSNEEARKRLESPEFLKLMKRCFRNWSAAESEEKRVLIRNLLSNAAMSTLCSDDVISLFIDWIDKYSEVHFKVIRAIYNESNGITRKEIWGKIYSTPVREDSAEADLFKLIIHELSVGHIIRQHREKDVYGNFIKVKVPKTSRRSNTYTSAFEDSKKYELTGLGNQFVHYTLNEIVARIESATRPE